MNYYRNKARLKAIIAKKKRWTTKKPKSVDEIRQIYKKAQNDLDPQINDDKTTNDVKNT